MMLIGAGIGTAGLTAAAFAPSTQLLIVFMFLTGAGTSIVPIAGIGAVFRSFPVTRRAWALGIRQTGVPLGGVIAAVVLPALAHASGVRAAFLFAAGALAVFGTVFALAADDGPVDVTSRPRPQLVRVLRLPGMGRLLAVSACYVVVLQSVLAYSVPSARDTGFSAFSAGAVFFVFQITAGVGRVVWGRIADLSGGNRRARTLAETGWLAAGGALAFAAALHAGPAAAIPAAIAFGFGGLGWNALAYVIAGERAPLELASQSVAVVGTLILLMGASSAPPMGALAEHAGWNVFWVVTAVFALGGSLIAFSLSRLPAPAVERV
jgi:MFS family permease